jgi:bifunctional UDP-N-acetylglucosamine pyrophosphorylase/glucosamine-1-phosphate N-acetyltransferase
MHSRRPKVLHPILGVPMLRYVVDAARGIDELDRLVVVVGHGADEVRRAFASDRSVQFALQSEQLGTGHALKVAVESFPDVEGELVVLCGDVPALDAATLRSLLDARRQSDASAAVLTAELADPTGYGRVLKDAQGCVTAIREDRDCSAEEKQVRRINSGMYAFDARALLAVLPQIDRRNSQGEYYLTDAIELLVRQGKRVVAVDAPDASSVLGVNDRAALVDLERMLQRRINAYWLARGVTVHQPETVRIGPGTRFAEDVVVEPNTVLFDCDIGRDVFVEAGCRLERCTVGEGTRLRQGTYAQEATIGARVVVGPFAHLRPGTVLGDEVRIGNFVETKQAKLGRGSKASHLSYIGDADIGANVNLGCGFITCNFDGGPVKHRTIIEDDVFVGSDSQTVAPVRLGKGSYVASGTTVTRDVPPDALAVARTRQENKEGYAERLRARTRRKPKE